MTLIGKNAFGFFHLDQFWLGLAKPLASGFTHDKFNTKGILSQEAQGVQGNHQRGAQASALGGRAQDPPVQDGGGRDCDPWGSSSWRPPRPP